MKMEKLNISPTKSNLLSTKSSLELAEEGYELLDKKRNVLIQEMMERIDEAKKIQSQINQYFYNAYEALQIVDITQGIKTVEEIAAGIDLIDDLNIRTYSVMGVEIPEVEELSQEIFPHYSFYALSYINNLESFISIIEITIDLRLYFLCFINPLHHFLN